MRNSNTCKKLLAMQIRQYFSTLIHCTFAATFLINLFHFKSILFGKYHKRKVFIFLSPSLTIKEEYSVYGICDEMIMSSCFTL